MDLVPLLILLIILAVIAVGAKWLIDYMAPGEPFRTLLLVLVCLLLILALLGHVSGHAPWVGVRV